MCDSATSRLAQRFTDRSLPCEEWTHEAHLRVGLWHVVRYGETEALDRLRRCIRSYNGVCGIANTDTSGYHETTTRFYVKLIAHFCETRGADDPIESLAEELIAALGDRRLPFDYYSRQRLMSVEARRGWLEPDLRPMPSAQQPFSTSTTGC